MTTLDQILLGTFGTLTTCAWVFILAIGIRAVQIAREEDEDNDL